MDKNIDKYSVGGLNNATIRGGFTGWRKIGGDSLRDNPINDNSKILPKASIQLENVEIETVKMDSNVNKMGNYDLDLSELLIDGVKVIPGDVINIKNQYGTLYKVYIPQDYNENTGMTVFYPGTDGIEGVNDSKVVLDYLKNNPNQIIFMSFASGSGSGQPMLSSITELREKLGFTEPINVFGFSRGAQFGEVFARNCITSGIDVKNLILIDPANDGSSLEWQSNGQVISTLKDAGTNVTVFSHNGNDFMRGYSYRHAQEAGLNVNVVSTVTGHNNHPQINRELIENGALDFFMGDCELKNLDYYQVLDNGTWREMNLDDANILR